MLSGTGTEVHLAQPKADRKVWLITVPGVPNDALHIDVFEVSDDGMGPGAFIISYDVHPNGRKALEASNCVLGV